MTVSQWSDDARGMPHVGNSRSQGAASKPCKNCTKRLIRCRINGLHDRRSELARPGVNFSDALPARIRHAHFFFLSSRSRVFLTSPSSGSSDRAGLERLLRCCARPAFASERLARRRAAPST